MTNDQAADLTKAAMLRNLKIVERLGCLDAEGMEDMRHGEAATVRRGPYKDDQLSVDHIIPRSVCPELDNVIANLELMPSRMTAKKNSKVGQRQRDLADKLYRAQLLGKAGWKSVLAHRSDLNEKAKASLLENHAHRTRPLQLWLQFTAAASRVGIGLANTWRMEQIRWLYIAAILWLVGFAASVWLGIWANRAECDCNAVVMDEL